MSISIYSHFRDMHIQHKIYVSVNVNVSSRFIIYIVHNRKAPNVLCTLVKREKFSGHNENCPQNASDVGSER